MKPLGDFPAGATIKFDFNTVDPETRVPFTLAGTPTVGVWKDGVKMTLDAAPTLHVDKENADAGASALTGLNWVVLDTTADADYTAGSDYVVKLTAGTVNGYSVVGQSIGSFTLENRETVLRDDSITVGKFATGVLSTDVELAQAFWAELLVDNDVAGSFGELLNNLVDSVVKKFGVPLTVAASPAPTTGGFSVTSASGLTNTQIDNALLLHLPTGRYTRITDITDVAITVSPVLPAAPTEGDEVVVFGKYLASL